jgi:predicted nucleic acid-binding protein
MIVLLDTNVILDVLLARKPFVNNSAKVLQMAEKCEIICYITANSVTDILYILKKYVKNRSERETIVRNLFEIVDIVSVTKKDIYKSFDYGYTDFEDALQYQCAKKLKAQYIITRNEKDFKDTEINVISPDRFIENISKL